MKFMLSDEVQVEGYAKLLNLTTRADMVDNKYFKSEPQVQDVAKALTVGRTPYTLKFFEQINSPQGPWLQMLQRAYYTDDDLDTVISDAKDADEGDRRSSEFSPWAAAEVLPHAAAPFMKTIAAVRDGWEDDGRMHSTSGRYVGLLYLAPALAFVVAFTALPVVQMLWMSLHNWSLIEPPKWVGFANYLRAYKDSQFWTSLRFTLKYTLYITPILMVGGFLIALLVAQNTNLRRFTRAVVFVPVVIGLGASSLLWYYLFSYDFGMVNRIALDLGIVRKPVVWFGENVDRSLWAVIASIVWKVIGFGMLLFVAAIQAIPGEINEAAVVDGASYWQRRQADHVAAHGAHHPPRDALQRHRIAARLRPVLLMTAGQPLNKTATSVFFVYLNSFPYLKLGYGAALSLILAIIVLTCTVAQLMLSRRSFG